MFYSSSVELIRLENLDSKIKDVVSALKAGNLIIFPTETLYGIGANALNEEAVRKIFTVKKRPESKPILILISEIEMLNKLVLEIPKIARDLIYKFWPGPLTIIFSAKGGSAFGGKNKTGLLNALNPYGNTVAIRMTSSKTAQKIITLCGFPITATSANLNGKEAIKNYKEAMEQFGNSSLIRYMIEDENMKDSKPSTIIDVSDGNLKIVREGVIEEREIRFLS
ncbi:MAG: threonylcarbamoyl-AMP synthase [Candidatus Pacebacteria bacterium]|nr:threonylcarbamoyl-AMP synthase [Candidatus Paceibacterota bacterium]